MNEVLSYLRIIRRWWWIIVLLPAVTLITMLLVLLLLEPHYESTVTVQVTAPPPQEVPLYSSLGWQALSDEITRVQTSLTELMTEGDVAYRVLEKVPDVPMTGEELRRRIEVDIPDNSHLMRISVKTGNPEMSALVANAIVETCLQQYAELSAKPTAGMRSFIELQLELAQSTYETAETELTEFQVANKIGSLGTALEQQYEIIRTLKVNRDLAETSDDIEKARALDELILSREAELQNLIGLSSEYYTLVGRVDRARDTYNFMLDKRAEAQIKENQILELASVQVITPARPAAKPVVAMNAKLIILGAAVSIMAGVLLAFLLAYMETSGVLQQLQTLNQPLPFDEQGNIVSAG
jgi:uncharacterized protein involved in exopolysaccharide biosynthesis